VITETMSDMAAAAATAAARPLPQVSQLPYLSVDELHSKTDAIAAAVFQTDIVIPAAAAAVRPLPQVSQLPYLSVDELSLNQHLDNVAAAAAAAARPLPQVSQLPYLSVDELHCMQRPSLPVPLLLLACEHTF
jgi:chorismate mutase